jgi:hypothetical protein
MSHHNRHTSLELAYGQDGTGSSDHTRRSISAVVKETRAGAMVASSPNHGMCPGDSGSPAFLVEDGKETLVGILSQGMPLAAPMRRT